MSEMYLIMTGEYSDRRCMGYCTTEDEARRYCAVKNSAGGYDEYDYEAAECLDGKVCGDSEAGVTVKVSFRWWGGEWRMDRVYHLYLDLRHPPRVRRGIGEIVVDVWMREYDTERARKAAQDALYEHLAQNVEMGTSESRDLSP